MKTMTKSELIARLAERNPRLVARDADEAVNTMLDAMTDALAGGQRIDDAQARADWAACREQTLPFFNPPSPAHGLWRVSVPQTAPVLNLPGPVMVEWQGAQRWCWAPVDQADAIRSVARAAGGHASLFRAPAQGAAGVPREDRPDPAIAAIQARLRAEFDPAGLFAPHAG